MRLRRFETLSSSKLPMTLADNHPAVVQGRPFFRKSANRNDTGRVLKSGMNSRKIGARVVKGKWRGMPIYTLTLEERATCPRSCKMWNSCYGNRMPWAVRYKAGEELEDKIWSEIHVLAVKHKRGFVVRLHVLGDFYSVDYVRIWSALLESYPELHIFGFTAWQPETAIGAAVQNVLNTGHGDQCWIRFSGVSEGLRSVVVYGEESLMESGAILCPAEAGKTSCCGSCGLCWTMTKPVAFMAH